MVFAGREQNSKTARAWVAQDPQLPCSLEEDHIFSSVFCSSKNHAMWNQISAAVYSGWKRCEEAQACFLQDTPDAKAPTPQMWRQLKMPHRIVQMEYNEDACGKGGGDKVRCKSARIYIQYRA